VSSRRSRRAEGVGVAGLDEERRVRAGASPRMGGGRGEKNGLAVEVVARGGDQEVMAGAKKRGRADAERARRRGGEPGEGKTARDRGGLRDRTKDGAGGRGDLALHTEEWDSWGPSETCDGWTKSGGGRERQAMRTMPLGHSETSEGDDYGQGSWPLVTSSSSSPNCSRDDGWTAEVTARRLAEYSHDDAVVDLEDAWGVRGVRGGETELESEVSMTPRRAVGAEAWRRSLREARRRRGAP